jgi:hypothetical protein
MVPGKSEMQHISDMIGRLMSFKPIIFPSKLAISDQNTAMISTFYVYYQIVSLGDPRPQTSRPYKNGHDLKLR